MRDRFSNALSSILTAVAILLVVGFVLRGFIRGIIGLIVIGAVIAVALFLLGLAGKLRR